MTGIYLAKNHLLLEAGYGNPEMHSHSACRVLIGLHGDMRMKRRIPATTVTVEM
ncbi:MAG: hypothetical protein NC389_07950 [Acetatifactor muris]|nr:hypothetical protein [Acetatifactor muris]